MIGRGAIGKPWVFYQLKHGIEDISNEMKKEITQLKNNKNFEQIDLILPVPLHPKKLKKRGYNQLTKFGGQISQQLQKPYDEDLLLRKVYLETQTKKDRAHRILNEDIFAVHDLESIKN